MTPSCSISRNKKMLLLQLIVRGRPTLYSPNSSISVLINDMYRDHELAQFRAQCIDMLMNSDIYQIDTLKNRISAGHLTTSNQQFYLRCSTELKLDLQSLFRPENVKYVDADQQTGARVVTATSIIRGHFTLLYFKVHRWFRRMRSQVEPLWTKSDTPRTVTPASPSTYHTYPARPPRLASPASFISSPTLSFTSFGNSSRSESKSPELSPEHT